MRVIEDLQPNVVLMDLRIPGMDGLEAAITQIWERWPHIAIVILTTYDEDDFMKPTFRSLRERFSEY